jgi:O-antigen ligase
MSIIAIVFVLLYFGGLILAFVKRAPIFGLGSYLLAFYLHPPIRWWGQSLPDLRWSFLASILTLAVLFINHKQNPIQFFKYKENKFLLLLFLFLLLQYFWAGNVHFHGIYVSLFFKLLILILIIQNSIKDEKDLIAFVFFNAIGCSYFGYVGLTEHSGGRLETAGGASLTSANQLAQHLGVILIFSAYSLLLKIPTKYKIISIVSTLLILETIMLTQSRTVILALVLTAVFVLIYAPPKDKKKLYLFVLLGGIAFSMLLGSQILNRISTLTADDESQVQDKSAASRMVIIKSQFEMFKDSPLLGHGHRSTLLLSPFYIPKQYLQANGFRASHNFIMAMLVDHGLIGTSLYFSVIYLCLMKARKIANFKVENENLLNIQTIGISFGIGLIFFLIVGLGSNNKVLEVDIWLYAIIPVIFNMIKSKSNTDRLNDN